MQVARRLASFERHLGVAAVFVGRAVTRGAGLLPRLVRRASGLEDPSPEAALAGLIRGVTALAPAALGTAGGGCIDAAGVAAVLALATWTVRAVSDDDDALGEAIDSAERRGLCDARTAWLWRTAVGLAPLIEPDLLKEGALAIAVAAARGAAKHGVSRISGPKVMGWRVLGVGLSLVDAWTAMGQAARLVEATRNVAEERRAECAVVIAFPARAA